MLGHLSVKYLSVCSGIEAATVAWHHMGWKPVGFSEIEKFPSQVLAHHYPDVPNLGDMTKFQEWPDESIDLLVGGTPCQAFSVAGLRGGLSDSRGNLTLTFVEMADHFDPEWIVWENVPGVLSSQDNAFGCFLAGLVGASEPLIPDGRWDNSGLVSGPKRTAAWRILDAQYFGVAQRRRRVFVCAVRGSGNWAAARAIFSVGESVFWDSAPRRETRKVAPTIPSRSTAGGGLGTDFDCDGGVIAARGVSTGSEPDLMNTLCATDAAKWGSNQWVKEGKAVLQPIALQDVRAVEKQQNGRGWNDDGTAYTVDTHATQGVVQPVAIQGNLIGRDSGGPQGIGVSENGAMYTLTKADVHGVAQPVAVDIDNCNLTGDCTGNILAGAQMRTNKGMGVMQPVAFHVNAQADQMNFSSETTASLTCSQRAGVAFRETADCLTAAYGTKWNGNASADNGSLFASQAMQVRRLTPTECERLQGFPDGYTNIKENCPDGPRYKALGNSMAVPVMRWIGERIQIVNELSDINKSKRAA